MTLPIRHQPDPGPTRKPVTSPFSGSFIVPIFKTMIFCLSTQMLSKIYFFSIQFNNNSNKKIKICQTHGFNPT